MSLIAVAAQHRVEGSHDRGVVANRSRGEASASNRVVSPPCAEAGTWRRTGPERSACGRLPPDVGRGGGRSSRCPRVERRHHHAIAPCVRRLGAGVRPAGGRLYLLRPPLPARLRSGDGQLGPALLHPGRARSLLRRRPRARRQRSRASGEHGTAVLAGVLPFVILRPGRFAPAPHSGRETPRPARHARPRLPRLVFTSRHLPFRALSRPPTQPARVTVRARQIGAGRSD
jgi:hypothetical protein